MVVTHERESQVAHAADRPQPPIVGTIKPTVIPKLTLGVAAGTGASQTSCLPKRARPTAGSPARPPQSPLHITAESLLVVGSLTAGCGRFSEPLPPTSDCTPRSRWLRSPEFDD